MKEENVWKLSEETVKIPNHHVKTLFGDFRVPTERKYKSIEGHHPPHWRIDKNRERFTNYCKAFARPPCKQESCTYNLLYDGGKFQIDYVAVSRNSMYEIQNVGMRKGAVVSYHNLTQIKLRFQCNRSTPKYSRIPRVDPKCLKENARSSYMTIENKIPREVRLTQHSADISNAIRIVSDEA